MLLRARRTVRRPARSTPCSPTPTRCPTPKDLTALRARDRRASRTVEARRRRQRGHATIRGGSSRGRIRARRSATRDPVRRGARMAMTAAVKDELSRVPVAKLSARKAEMATMLRFAGALHLVGGHIVDRGRARHRLGRAPAAQGDRRDLRLRLRGADRRRRRPAQGQPLPRAGHQGRRGARPPGRPGRPARPAGERAAAPRRRRRHRRCRGRLARRVPRARLAHRARPRLRAGDHLPVGRGRAGARRRRPAAGRLGQGPRGARRRPGRGPRRRRDRRAAHPASARTIASWPGRSGGCAARCAPPRTGWPTSTTPTCAARRGPRSRPARGSSARWRSSTTTRPDHLLQAGRLRLEHKQASLEELGALSDPVMTKDAVAGRIRRLLAMADKRAADLGIPDTESAVTPGDARPVSACTRRRRSRSAAR